MQKARSPHEAHVKVHKGVGEHLLETTVRSGTVKELHECAHWSAVLRGKYNTKLVVRHDAKLALARFDK